MTDQDRIKELERKIEALKARLSANDTQPDNSASSVTPSVPLWKKIVGGLLLLLLCVGAYYCYKGYTIQVLTYLDMFIFGLGVVLVFVFLFSKETFLWLIGKKREYYNILKAGQSLTTGAVGTALKYAPIDLNNPEKEKIKRDVPALVEMGLMTGINNYIIRFFIGTFAASFALLGTIVLMNQNVKITTQNNLVAKQNKRLDQQTYLQEAERRSSLVFLFSNIMDAVDDELKTDIGEKGVRDLSPQLIGRITGLSTRLKPYRYLDGDSLTAKPLSPERGQLLVSLLGSKLDTMTMNKIYYKADFSNSDLQRGKMGTVYLRGVDLRGADLGEVDLRKADLAEADLAEADLRGAYLRGADLTEADLTKVDLTEADLREADLREADLAEADLRGAYLRNKYLKDTSLAYSLGMTSFNWADLSGVNLSGANLVGANLAGINLSKVDLSEVDLIKVDLSKADLSKANLSKAYLGKANLAGANLYGANLYGANLSKADLSKADLYEANLYKTDLYGANLKGANLKGVEIHRNFLQEIKSYPDSELIIGTQQIIENYQIDSTFKELKNRWMYYLKSNDS